MLKSQIFGLAVASVIAASLPATAYWNPQEEPFIEGRHPKVIVDALAAQGIKVERLEERNELVLAFVREDDGGTSIQFFDPDNSYRRVFHGGR